MSKLKTGNILGELTAEADGQMLANAFCESRNYRTLIQDTDFRFVVGRRGTGKSALFERVASALRNERQVLLVTERPTEEKVSAWHDELQRLTQDYMETRKLSRLAWKIQVLTQALELLLADYKARRLDGYEQLLRYRDLHPELWKHTGLSRGLAAFRIAVAACPGVSPGALPERIADYFDVGTLHHLVCEGLRACNKRVVFLYDGLDEGWVPNATATGLLGGLAKIASEFREAQGIHCLLFVRDNMFRALADLDGDYSRNIEGNVLRLHWDEESLLNLVALRLRFAFDWKGENDVRAWNRFAKRGFEGKDGFRRCLKLTLYRPRDVIAVLNAAFQVASTNGRQEIIDTDVETAATRISQTRLNDLYKEYDGVLPGLQQFAEAFRGGPTTSTYGAVLRLLDEVVERPEKGMIARDFALLRTGADAFAALYSVGFFGIKDNSAESYRFCHDGSNTDVQAIEATRPLVVHPCYWRGLALDDQSQDERLVVALDDEEDAAVAEPVKKAITDMRVRKLGTVIAELGQIPEGRPGAEAFEEWVYDAARYLFAKGLDNLSWKPNPGQVQQRDIVGTVNEATPFWRRIAKYDVSQFIIEAKNFRDVAAPEFRQAWGYLKGPYGRCMLMITRATEESLTEHERALVKEGYDNEPHKLVVLMPAILLQRALRKMQSRNEKREDYIDDMLKKRLDVFERDYIHQRTPRAARAKRR